MHYGYRVAAIFLLGFFIDCINIFMSAIALPSIAAQMSVATESISWVANSYILGLTLIVPLSGWLASRFGTRQTIVASMLIFSIAALGCARADSFSTLVAWRFIQGAGGGLLIPVGQALTFNLFQGRQRAAISTLIMCVALIAPALSPLLGGMLVDVLSWRWIFYSNIPFSLLAALLAAIWIRPQAMDRTRADITGIILVCGTLGTLLRSLSLFSEQHAVLQAALWLGVSLLLGCGYLRHYRRQSTAILDLSLLRNPQLNLSIAVYYAVPGVFTGVNLLNIFYLQQVLHFSAGHTGSFMLLYGVGALAAMLVAGRIYYRAGAPRLFICGMLLHSGGIALLSLVSDTSSSGILCAAYLLMGIGGGIAANCAQTTALIELNEQQMSGGSTLWNINRQLTFSLGTALFTLLLAVLSRYFPGELAWHLAFIIAAVSGLLPLWLIYQRRFHKEIQ
ncbi:MFS transporter [Pantoea coffeiphila]|uniref:MFS transporter n=1 Tax=Pantoea coffeiphila TaxID=1465635 RepID=UPI001961E18B|nr:MFS transporter [Pantoea coffeiphila]